MNNYPFPKTRDVLVNQLECKIRFMEPLHASEVFASFMAVERSNKEILDLLTNESLLEEKIEEITLALDKDRREILGTKLFHAVSKFEQELSAQVTGMLLELPLPVVTELLDNPIELKKAVTKAKKEFLAHKTETCYVDKNEHFRDEDSSESRDKTTLEEESPNNKEEIGEILYEKLCRTYSEEEASKITGMLLQMSLDHLQLLLQDEEILQAKVRLSFDVLNRIGESS